MDSYIKKTDALTEGASELASIEAQLRAYGGTEAVLDLERINQLSSSHEVNAALGYLIKKIHGE